MEHDQYAGTSPSEALECLPRFCSLRRGLVKSTGPIEFGAVSILLGKLFDNNLPTLLEGGSFDMVGQASREK